MVMRLPHYQIYLYAYTYGYKEDQEIRTDPH